MIRPVRKLAAKGTENVVVAASLATRYTTSSVSKRLA